MIHQMMPTVDMNHATLWCVNQWLFTFVTHMRYNALKFQYLSILHWRAVHDWSSNFWFCFQFTGIWYAVQKTSTASTCLVYNITRGEEPREYFIEQTSQHFALGLTPLKHEYSYTGRISVPDPMVPAKMAVRFPLSEYDNDLSVWACLCE